MRWYYVDLRLIWDWLDTVINSETGAGYFNTHRVDLNVASYL